jgi:FkbM family methyltransferase
MTASPNFLMFRGHTIYAPPLGATSVIVDLGAHRGEFSTQMSAHFGGCYYLVEANPVLVERLHSECPFPVWHGAVGDTNGPVTLDLAKDPEASSLLPLDPDSPWPIARIGQIEVPGRSLESLIGDMGLRRIDVLKVDIEGAEMAVLGHLPPAILREIGQITIEFHGYAFGPPLWAQTEDVIRRLRGHGFLCLDFSKTMRVNVLCINLARHPVPWLRRLRWTVRTMPPSWAVRGWRALPPSWTRRLRRLVARVSSVDEEAWIAPATPNADVDTQPM